MEESFKQPVIVKQLRQILIWPLHLEGKSEEGWLEECVREVGDKQSPWSEIDDVHLRDPRRTERVAYQEFVYFHPFVQDLLFGENRPFRVFGRSDVSKVDVELNCGTGARRVVLDVHRLHLYLFKSRIAVLVLEVGSSDLDLPSAQDFLDQFRRAYPAFWSGGAGGHCPLKVRWLRTDGREVGRYSDFESQEKHIRSALKHKEPPIAAHWRWLLQPLVSVGDPDGADQCVKYRHIVDERIPGMAYLAVDDPTRLKDGDWVRLCFFDEEGSSDTLPYATDFLKHFKKQCCYDRFWETEDKRGHDWMQTRYMCCAYAFVQVCRADYSMSLDEENGLLCHFRNHYFQLGLIAHFQKASLLLFSKRLGVAVNEKDEKKRRRKVQDIRHELLEFTHGCWFTEVSNQEQGRELFEMIQRHLRCSELYDMVMEEASGSDQLLDRDWQNAQTSGIRNLTLIATFGLWVSLSFSFFSMQIFVDYLTANLSEVSAFVVVFFLIGIFFGAIYLCCRFHTDK